MINMLTHLYVKNKTTTRSILLFIGYHSVLRAVKKYNFLRPSHELAYTTLHTKKSAPGNGKSIL